MCRMAGAGPHAGGAALHARVFMHVRTLSRPATSVHATCITTPAIAASVGAAALAALAAGAANDPATVPSTIITTITSAATVAATVAAAIAVAAITTRASCSSSSSQPAAAIPTHTACSSAVASHHVHCVHGGKLLSRRHKHPAAMQWGHALKRFRTDWARWLR